MRPSPLQVFKRMTHDGKSIGAFQLIAALQSQDIELEDYIVNAVKTHNDLISTLKIIKGYILGDSYSKAMAMLETVLLKMEGKE